ncbi:adenine-specific methyltransferase EcoRI family protein [Mycoplasma sp. VS31B]
MSNEKFTNWEEVKQTNDHERTSNILENFTQWQRKHETDNGAMNKAAKVKMDEFYTPYEIIDEEFKYWLELDPDFFKGKTVIMPSDRVERELMGEISERTSSQFWNYFHLNFSHLGLKKIAATYLKNEAEETAYMYEYSGGDDANIFDYVKTPLQSNGDFFSPEIIELMKTHDLTITNPPFSLWSKWYPVLKENRIDFIVIGNKLSVGYKSILPDFLAKSYNICYSHPKYFLKYPEASGISEESARVKLSGMTCFITNLPINFEMREEIEKKKKNNGPVYFDNTNIINIDKLEELKTDYANYEGLLGVPVTFLFWYDKDKSQYEVISILDKNLNYINGRQKFNRILIRKKCSQVEEEKRQG